MDEDFEILDENNSNLNMNNSMPNKQNKEKITKKNNNISTKTSSTNKENTNVFKNNKTNGISRIKNAVNKNSKNTNETKKLSKKGIHMPITKNRGVSNTEDEGANTLDKSISSVPVVGSALGAGISTANRMTKDNDSKKSNNKTQTKSNNKTEETVNKVAKGTIKAAKTTTKLLIVFWPITLGLAIALFVIYLIIGPLADAWSSIDKGARDVANTVEKMTNFYRGFGFQDSKQAFFEEIDDLQEFYDDSLDLPLLLSSIFYPETMGYDTSYQDHMEVINSDPVTEAFDGGLDSLFSYFGSWAKDILKEAGNTYDDETQLTYNAGKIYRLRRLAAAMCDRNGTEVTVSLSTFLAKYGSMFKKTVLDVLSSVGNLILEYIIESVSLVFKTVVNTVTLNFDDIGDDFNNFKDKMTEAGNNILNSITVLLNVASFGLCTLTSVHFDVVEGISVSYIPYKVNQDKYDAYLKDYYFEDTPEFYRLLPKEETLRNQKKAVMVSEIYEQRNLFKDIFLQYEDGEVEAYANNCVGALNNGLIKNLRLPVDIPDGYDVDFGDSGFGMRVHPTTGVNQMHNGVDINGYSAGVHEGDNVYAVAPGKVISSDPTMQTSESNWAGAWVRIEHTIDVDGKEYKFISVYMHLQTNSGQPAVGSSVSKGQVIGKIGTTGDSTGPHLHFEIREPDGSTYGNAIDPTNLFKPCPSTELVGADNQEKIWNYLVGKGYTKQGTAGIMGNMMGESNCFPQRVQNDYSEGYIDSINYTSQVDNGQISRNDFVYNGPGGNGYGLVQWTWHTFKEDLYDISKEKKVSIGDLGFQLDYLHKSLTEDYKSVYDVVSTTTDIKTASNYFLDNYENPQEKNYGERYNFSLDAYNAFANKAN